MEGKNTRHRTVSYSFHLETFHKKSSLITHFQEPTPLRPPPAATHYDSDSDSEKR